MIVIGIDPGSKKSGWSKYYNGILSELDNKSFFDLVTELYRLKSEYSTKDILFVVESVNSNQFVYSKRWSSDDNKKKAAKKGMGIGKNQMVSVLIIEMIEGLGFKCHKIKPQRGNWAKNPELFMHITGWPKGSNKDARSAAFFGMIGVNSIDK